jgi:chromosome segregation ATPase
MSQEARISSVLVLMQLRASLVTFAATASLALEEASTDIQRTRRWLAEDRYRHWRTQVQVRAERLARAKIALKQKEVFDRTLAGTPSSCVDEKKALKVAEGRLRDAEHKLSRVKAWSREIEKELSDYRGTVQRLVSAIEVEIPNARARLDKMIDSLEAYLALAPPEMPKGANERELRMADGGLPIEPVAPNPKSEIPNPQSEKAP